MRTFGRAVGTVSMLLLSATTAGAQQGSPVKVALVTPVTSDQKPVAPGKPAHVQIIACRAKEYTTMKQLAVESAIVIRGVALTEKKFDKIAEMPFVATTVEVTESFRGAAKGGQIKVRQMAASPDVIIDDVIPVLQTGNEYILYLTPSGLKSKADQYSITGGAGGFLYHADGTADRLDDLSRKLPTQITATTVRKSLKKFS